jgi:hypothetical protein
MFKSDEKTKKEVSKQASAQPEMEVTPPHGTTAVHGVPHGVGVGVHESPSLAMPAEAIAYHLRSDYATVAKNGQVTQYKAGHIFRVPQDAQAISMLREQQADIHPLKHMETCPNCKCSHPCTRTVSLAETVL